MGQRPSRRRQSESLGVVQAARNEGLELILDADCLILMMLDSVSGSRIPGFGASSFKFQYRIPGLGLGCRLGLGM
jgi:hypothetical protein